MMSIRNDNNDTSDDFDDNDSNNEKYMCIIFYMCIYIYIILCVCVARPFWIALLVSPLRLFHAFIAPAQSARGGQTLKHESRRSLPIIA